MKLRWLNAYLSELRPLEGFAEIPIGLRVICQYAMAYGYIVIRYEGIVIVSDLAVLHMKFDALNDFLRLEIDYAESVQGQGCPKRVLEDARTEVQALVETESHLKVLLILI